MGRGARPGDDRLPVSPAVAALTLASVKARLKIEEPRPGDTTLIFIQYVPDVGARSRYLVTTDPYELTEETWAARARALVNRLAGEDRGRVVFCLDRLENLPMAAIAFHFEGRTAPFHVRAIAERQDVHAAHSVECARLLKRCLHLFSLALGGTGELFYDAPGGAQEARARGPYEFKTAPRQRGRRPGGTLLVQDAPPGV